MDTTQAQSKKTNNSLVWRLAFAQVGRICGVFLRVDGWILLITLFSLIYWGEWQGYAAFEKQDAIYQQLQQQAPPVPLVPSGAEYSISTEKRGITLLHKIEQAGIVPKDSYRAFSLKNTTEPKEDVYAKDFSLKLFSDQSIQYQVFLPQGNNDYLLVSTDFSHLISVFLTGFSVLLAIQIITVISSIWKSQRSITRTLRPLYDLTYAAQTISTATDLSVPLSSAINALDTITENHLDRRISIVDERAELQGLAIAINNMLDRLDDSYQAQLRFVSDASHELRTPIAIIQGYANLLERWGKDNPETLEESIQAIKSESEGMQTLVEQLLFLARSDNQSIPITKQNIDISAIMAEVVKETEMIQKTHPITSAITPDLWVVGDPQLLKQCIRVLVENSLKYTPENGLVQFTAQRRENQVVLSVSDTGIGMNEEETAHVFERFWRADEARTRKSGGTGLGLSIAKWIADTHSGYLEITSRKGLGTKTSLLLPYLPPLESPAPVATETTLF